MARIGLRRIFIEIFNTNAVEKKEKCNSNLLFKKQLTASTRQFPKFHPFSNSLVSISVFFCLSNKKKQKKQPQHQTSVCLGSEVSLANPANLHKATRPPAH